MCCGKAFWGRFLVFGLTFALGLLAAGFFTLRTATTEFCPDLKREQPVAEKRNCVPVDENLKYEQLSVEENGKYYPLVEKPKTEAEKDKQKSSENKPENPEPDAQSSPQKFDPSKNPAKIKDLLHREKCFGTPDMK